jgi:hypothetical protein
VALAISNIVLATRLAQLRRPATVERAAVEPAAPAASVPSPPTSPTPPSPPPAATSAPAPEATAPAPATPARVQSELPPRPMPRTAVRAERAAARAETKTEAAPAPWSRERSTASWMVQEYGRPDAEARARAAVDFYDTRSPEAAYWRRVLGEIVSARR